MRACMCACVRVCFSADACAVLASLSSDMSPAAACHEQASKLLHRLAYILCQAEVGGSNDTSPVNSPKHSIPPMFEYPEVVPRRSPVLARTKALNKRGLDSPKPQRRRINGNELVDSDIDDVATSEMRCLSDSSMDNSSSGVIKPPTSPVSRIRQKFSSNMAKTRGPTKTSWTSPTKSSKISPMKHTRRASLKSSSFTSSDCVSDRDSIFKPIARIYGSALGCSAPSISSHLDHSATGSGDALSYDAISIPGSPSGSTNCLPEISYTCRWRSNPSSGRLSSETQIKGGPSVVRRIAKAYEERSRPNSPVSTSPRVIPRLSLHRPTSTTATTSSDSEFERDGNSKPFTRRSTAESIESAKEEEEDESIYEAEPLTVATSCQSYEATNVAVGADDIYLEMTSSEDCGAKGSHSTLPYDVTSSTMPPSVPQRNPRHFSHSAPSGEACAVSPSSPEDLYMGMMPAPPVLGHRSSPVGLKQSTAATDSATDVDYLPTGSRPRRHSSGAICKDMIKSVFGSRTPPFAQQRQADQATTDNPFPTAAPDSKSGDMSKRRLRRSSSSGSLCSVSGFSDLPQIIPSSRIASERRCSEHWNSSTDSNTSSWRPTPPPLPNHPLRPLPQSSIQLHNALASVSEFDTNFSISALGSSAFAAGAQMVAPQSSRSSSAMDPTVPDVPADDEEIDEMYMDMAQAASELLSSAACSASTSKDSLVMQHDSVSSHQTASSPTNPNCNCTGQTSGSPTLSTPGDIDSLGNSPTAGEQDWADIYMDMSAADIDDATTTPPTQQQQQQQQQEQQEEGERDEENDADGIDVYMSMSAVEAMNIGDVNDKVSPPPMQQQQQQQEDTKHTTMQSTSAPLSVDDDIYEDMAVRTFNRKSQRKPTEQKSTRTRTMSADTLDRVGDESRMQRALRQHPADLTCSISADMAITLLIGSLQKLSSAKKWMTRYCCLETFCFMYSSKPNMKASVSCLVDLTGYTVGMDRSNGRFAFRLAHTKKRCFVFRGHDDDDCHHWMATLGQVIAACRRRVKRTTSSSSSSSSSRSKIHRVIG